MSEENFRQAIEQPSDRIIVALDNMGWKEAHQTVAELDGYIGLAKANSLAQQRGWHETIEYMLGNGALAMADAKYKDIPNTMRNHLKAVTECGPQFVTVFADNTEEAMEAAVEGRDEGRANVVNKSAGFGVWRRLHALGFKHENVGGILGVTVLTSIDKDQCVSIYGDEPQKKVMQFAHTALEAGLDGIVCSGEELEAIRADESLNDLLTVVPGITPEWANKADDQKRIVTPGEAIRRGADYIVVGRAITKPPEGIDRTEAAQRIAQELKEAA